MKAEKPNKEIEWVSKNYHEQKIKRLEHNWCVLMKQLAEKDKRIQELEKEAGHELILTKKTDMYRLYDMEYAIESSGKDCLGCFRPRNECICGRWIPLKD